MLSETEMLARFAKWGNAHEGVRAMVLTSTRTVPNAALDLFSDYDLILILTDIYPLFEDRRWLGDFGPVLTVYRDPILLQDGLKESGYVVQYEDGLKIDFTLWQVEALRRVVTAAQLPSEFDAGYRVVLDKDGLTQGLQPPTYKAYIPTPPSEPQYLEMIEVFFGDTFYVAKFLWRDDLVAAKYILDYALKQDYLVPMLVYRSEIDHGWTVKPGPYGRRLKRWLRPDLWAALESTYTGADEAANWEALFRTIALFQQVAVEVGEHLGYAYPDDLHRRAVAYLHKVRQLDRNAQAFP